MTDWKKICAVSDVPVLGSRVVDSEAHGRIAVFRNSADEVFAVHDKCPHKAGPLSQGIAPCRDQVGGAHRKWGTTHRGSGRWGGL